MFVDYAPAATRTASLTSYVFTSTVNALSLNVCILYTHIMYIHQDESTYTFINRIYTNKNNKNKNEFITITETMMEIIHY